MGQKKDFDDAGGCSCRLLCTSDSLCSNEFWNFTPKVQFTNKKEFHVAKCEGFHEVRVLIIFVIFP